MNILLGHVPNFLDRRDDRISLDHAPVYWFNWIRQEAPPILIRGAKNKMVTGIIFWSVSKSLQFKSLKVKKRAIKSQVCLTMNKFNNKCSPLQMIRGS